jgi:hypothetical protein
MHLGSAFGLSSSLAMPEMQVVSLSSALRHSLRTASISSRTAEIGAALTGVSIALSVVKFIVFLLNTGQFVYLSHRAEAYNGIMFLALGKSQVPIATAIGFDGMLSDMEVFAVLALHVSSFGGSSSIIATLSFVLLHTSQSPGQQSPSQREGMYAHFEQLIVSTV